MKQADDLVSLVEAAYYNAYWNGASKHKKSLESVVKGIYKNVSRHKEEVVPIDYEAINKEFAGMEELRKYGWTKK